MIGTFLEKMDNMQKQMDKVIIEMETLRKY